MIHKTITKNIYKTLRFSIFYFMTITPILRHVIQKRGFLINFFKFV